MIQKISKNKYKYVKLFTNTLYKGSYIKIYTTYYI